MPTPYPNAQQSTAEAKRTLPATGENIGSSSGWLELLDVELVWHVDVVDLNEAATAFTNSSNFTRWTCASAGLIFNSKMSRSILLKIRIGVSC